MTLSASDPADARARRHNHREHSGSSYQPPYAAIVVDGNSGRVLHASNPDNLRHPASLTKIMTLYLLFEQLEAGQLKLDSRLSVSDRRQRDGFRQADDPQGARDGHDPYRLSQCVRAAR